MAERPDLYRILQVDPSANPLVIQAAYRALAQIHHPDVSGDSDEMKRLNAAWEILGDAKKRRSYDIERAGRHAPQSAHPSAQPGVAHHASTSRAGASSAAGSHAHGGATANTGAETAAQPTTARAEDHAGPPQGPASGSVLRFGRYEGWSIGQIARLDPPFLEWLRRVPAGRQLKDEIDVALRRADGARRMGVPNRAAEGSEAPVHTWAPGAPTRVR